MKYHLKSIENFLYNNEENEMYDFKNEYIYLEGRRKVKELHTIFDNLERFKQYKNNKDRFDCDGTGEGDDQDICMLTRKIYRSLWDWNDDPEGDNSLLRFATSCFDNDLRMGPDTINSVQTTLNLIIEGKIKGIVEEDFNEFAKFIHCLGNFVLVPAYFNRRRLPFADYWDLSLQYLKNHSFRTSAYKDNEISYDKKCFTKYINTFFLWDYVYNENDKYIIKPLFKDSFCDSKFQNVEKLRESEKIKPKDKNEVEAFLSNVEWAITRRSCFMFAMLKIADKHKEIYNKLLDKIFLIETIYSDYNDVFVAIEKILSPEEYNDEIKTIIAVAKEKISNIQKKMLKN